MDHPSIAGMYEALTAQGRIRVRACDMVQGREHPTPTSAGLEAMRIHEVMRLEVAA